MQKPRNLLRLRGFFGCGDSHPPLPNPHGLGAAVPAKPPQFDGLPRMITSGAGSELG
jgi:hypothetical protein